MHNRTRTILLNLCRTHFAVILAVILITSGNVVASEANPKIRIAILPCTDIVKTFIKYQPLQKYLEHELGRKVEILIPNSLQSFKKIIRSNEADFAFQTAHVYLMLSKQYNTHIIIKSLTKKGKGSHRGVIIARRDSGIKNIEDLRGKAVIFGPAYSTAKWLAPVNLLLKNGIDPNKDLKDYSHSNSCESIAMKICLGQGDAGAICEYSYKEIADNKSPSPDEIPPDVLTVIAKTQKIPNWIFAARKGIDDLTVVRVTEALLNLNRKKSEQKEIFAKLELGGFVQTDESELKSFEKDLLFAERPRP